MEIIKELCLILHSKRLNMKKVVWVVLTVSLLLSSCAKEFNQVYKSSDYQYKYEYAKECFAAGKYARAVSLLQEIIVPAKGSAFAGESLYMLAMAEYLDADYATASETFKRYVSSYPRGQFAELAKFYAGQSLYMDTPEPRLDQSGTVSAIAAFQEYLDLYPDAKMKEVGQQRLMTLQDKLVEKELKSAQLYYDLGSYFGNCTSGGNNYEACIVTAQNALKDYPYSNRREEFALLVMKSKFELAQQSVESKKMQRFQDAEDECYGFINEYPDSKDRKLAENYIEKCKKITKTASDA